MKADRIVVKPAPSGKGYIWHFVARNGRIRANNQVFADRAGAVQAVKGLVRNVAGMLGIAPTFRTRRDGSSTIITVEAGDFVL